MHPDRDTETVAMYAYFRRMLVIKFSTAQLALHDYYSSRDPLYQSESADEEFPLSDGLSEQLVEALELEVELELSNFELPVSKNEELS